MVRGPACRFPMPAAVSVRRQRLQSRSSRNHLWFATLPIPTFRVPSPDQRAFNPRPPGAHRESVPPRCCHPPSAAVRRWVPSWPDFGTGSRSPHWASPSLRALPRPAAPGGAGAFGERRSLPRLPRVPRPARPGGVATEATRGGRSAWLGSERSGGPEGSPNAHCDPHGRGRQKSL